MANRRPTSEFSRLADDTQRRLRTMGQYGSDIDLHINERYGVAVIGVHTRHDVECQRGGEDRIYLLRRNGDLEKIADESFTIGHLFLNGFSRNGKRFTYTIAGTNDGGDPLYSMNGRYTFEIRD